MFPLSPQQEMVWLHRQVAPTSSAYHFVADIELTGPLSVPLLVEAVEQVVRRHPGARLAFTGDGPELPRQHVVPEVELPFEQVDLREEPDPQAALAALLREQTAKPYDLTSAPLMRWVLARTGEQHHHLVHGEHHLVHDGRGFAVFLRDLFAAYTALSAGRPVELPEPVDYTDYVEHLAGAEHREAVARDLDFWRGRLAGLEGPATFRGLVTEVDGARDYRGDQVRQALPPELTEQVADVARKRGHTPFAVLFGVFGELLRRHSGQDDVVIGTASANRPERFEHMVGMCINSLPVRVRHEPDWRGQDAVDATMDALFDALDHQSPPLPEIVRATGASSARFDTPTFRVMFSLHDSALPEQAPPGLRVDLHEGLNFTASRGFDLDVVLLPGHRAVGGEGPGGLTLVWDFSAQHLTREAVRLLCQRYERLLRAYLADPDAPVRELAMTGPGDEPVLAFAEAAPPVAEGGIPAAVRAHAVARPTARALVQGAEVLSYRALADRLDVWVQALAGLGLRRGDVVAAVAPRGQWPIFLLLACLDLDVVFAPLPAASPDSRVADLVRDLGARVVFAEDERRPALSRLGLPTGNPAAPHRARVAEPVAAPVPAAYVISTSGSTGTPKRVAVPEPALRASVDGSVHAYGLGPDDVVLQFASPAFDVFFEEALPALVAGAALVLPATAAPAGRDLVALVLARGVTVVNLPTSYLANSPELVELLAQRPHSLRLAVLGGERLPAALADSLATALPRGRVVNAYGVTEATITSTAHEHRAGTTEGELPIGRPVPGAGVAVLQDGRPQPAGVPGEIVLAGAGVSAWYVGEEELTALRFRATPLADRCYHSGDLGHWDQHGELRFLGRGDRQIKLHGYRLELEEVEYAARRTSGADCVVVLDESGFTPRLVGFVQASGQEAVTALADALPSVLPPHAVPSAWVPMDPIPRTADGKVDYPALREHAAKAGTEESVGHVEGADPMLDLALGVFRTVLRRQDIGPETDFFAAGGYSLLVAQLAARLGDELGARPPLRGVFDHPRPRALASWLRGWLADGTATR
nr:condensation domain-containing protein [Crossiella equi]